MKDFAELRRVLMDRLDTARELKDEEILELIDELVIQNGRGRSLLEKEELRRELFYSVRKLDVLQDLMEDARVTEIMVNGYRNIFIEREGRLSRYEKQFTSREKLEDVIQQIVGRCNRAVNEQNPIVDARLENGDRVNVVMNPVALNGPILTIRKFPAEPITMQQLVRGKSLTGEAAQFLQNLVTAGYSILIGGGTSTGKTTFLNALSNYIPKNERVITIEDSAELQIQGIENLVRMETRSAALEGMREITMRDLIKTALRMRPNRIIIGEVRSAETVDMLQAWNTGASGSMGTAHANSTRDMVSRLETMVLMGLQIPLEAVRRQIASAVDIMIHLNRLRDGMRIVEEIAEVCGMENGEVKIKPLYRFEEGEGLCQVGELENREKLERYALPENRDMTVTNGV